MDNLLDALASLGWAVVGGVGAALILIVLTTIHDIRYIRFLKRHEAKIRERSESEV